VTLCHKYVNFIADKKSSDNLNRDIW